MRRADRAVWVTEGLTTIPEDIYDETKLAAEALCRDAFAEGFVTMALRTRAPGLLRAFAARGWTLPTSIDRVYVTRKAQRELRFQPHFGWESLL